MSDSSTPQCDSDPWIGVTYFWGTPGPHYLVFARLAGNVRLKTIFGILGCYYCALTWTLFDHALTFYDEVVYVWQRPMRAGSILFYLLRYLGIASLLAGIAIYSWPESEFTYTHPMGIRRECAPYRPVPDLLAGQADRLMYWGAPAYQFPVFWIVELVLQTRIFALYGNIRLAIFNGFIFTLEMAAMIYLWWGPAFSPIESLGSDSDRPSLEYTYAALYWLPGIGFELWLAALAFRKLRPQVLKHDLLSVIVRDSIRYFFLVAVVMVAHVVGSFEAFGSYVIPFVIAGQTIAGSRLVLHLRRAYFRGHDAGGSANISFTTRTTGIPVPRNRFADETFYVQENLSDDEFMEDVI